MVGTTSALKFSLTETGPEDFYLVGSAGFSLGETEHTSLRVYDGVPYLAFVDVANCYRATVMYYHKRMRRWFPLGEPGFSKVPVNYTCLYIDDGIPYVAYKERLQKSKVVVMKYNGTRWEKVGDPVFCGSEVNYVALFVESGIPYVAFTESGSYKGRVMKYEPKAGWLPIGRNFSEKFVGYISLFVDQGIPYVAYTEGDDIPWCTLGKLAVSKYDYDAAKGKYDWMPVGQQDFFGIAFYTSLYVEQGISYVAYGDGNELCKISVAKCIYDSKQGTHRWTPVGMTGFSEGNVVYPNLDFDHGIPYVAFRDDMNGYGATVMKYDVCQWVYVGEPGFSEGEVNYVSLQVENGRAFVAYADGNNRDRATVMANRIGERFSGLK